jgi:hypothetical protein
MDERDACYTIERLHQNITEFNGGISDCGAWLVEEVRRHMGRAAQLDDMCLVCCGRMPKS